MSDDKEKALEKLLDDKVDREVFRVLEFLGRRHEDGSVRGKNITTILHYLISTKEEEYQKTLSKLSLMLGINRRWLKENYFDGLEAFGLIEVFMNGGKKYWRWRGLNV